MRPCFSLLCAVFLVAPARSLAQEEPAIPEDLQRTYGAFAAALIEGDAETAIEFYAEDAVVLVDHEHVYRGRAAILDGFLRGYLEDASGAEEDGSGTEIGVDRVVVGEDVVTLAGRYANQAGAAGVYSNTWQRQADGSWKLAASVLTFGSSVRTPSRSETGFSCTQVLGFSQSMEWYAGLSLADYVDRNARPDLSALDPDAFLPAWQGRFFMGAAVERWTDPDFAGWSGPDRLAHETPARCGRDEVDRVVFNVSGAARSPDAWAAAVDSVADVPVELPGGARDRDAARGGSPGGEMHGRAGGPEPARHRRGHSAGGRPRRDHGRPEPESRELRPVQRRPRTPDGRGCRARPANPPRALPFPARRARARSKRLET